MGSYFAFFFQSIGWPPPTVKWYEGHQLLDDSYTVDYIRKAVTNKMTLSPLTRDDLGRRLTCVASNTNNTKPVTSNVVLTMTCK